MTIDNHIQTLSKRFAGRSAEELLVPHLIEHSLDSFYALSLYLQIGWLALCNTDSVISRPATCR